MTYVDSIHMDGIQELDTGINTYLQLKAEGLTNKNTVLVSNVVRYPIGYFNKENMELFKYGIDNLQRLAMLADKEELLSPKYKECSDMFIEETYKYSFEDPYDYENMLKAFSKTAEEDLSMPLFDMDQWFVIRDKRNRKIEEVYDPEFSKAK